jgi:hypothetical protein
MTYVGLKVEGVVTVTKAHLALSIDLSLRTLVHRQARPAHQQMQQWLILGNAL